MRVDDEIFESNILALAKLLKRIEGKVDKLIVTSNTVMNERLLDNQDLCLFLKVSPRTLQRYRNLGLLPYKVISKRNYYKESDIKAFVEEHFDGKTEITDKDKWQRKNKKGKRRDDDDEGVLV